MEETILTSERKKNKILFPILWGVIALLFVALIICSVIDFNYYKKGQDFAVTTLLAATDEFTDSGDRESLINEMRRFLTPTSISTTYTINGRKIYYNNSEVVESARKADRSLGEILTKEGYNCFYGSDFLEYTNTWEILYGRGFVGGAVILAILALILLAIHLLYLDNMKKMLVLTEDKIICKKGSKTKKEFMIRDIKSVNIRGKRGIKIVGDNLKYSIGSLINREDIKTFIMNKLSSFQKENTPVNLGSAADELAKYKQLLDINAITTEEYDAKKKQLLGL